MRALSRYSSLSLSNTNLVGVLPASIGALIHLTTLDLRSNALVGPIPEAFAAMRALEYVHPRAPSVAARAHVFVVCECACVPVAAARTVCFCCM